MWNFWYDIRFVKVYGEPPENESFPDIIYTYVDLVNSIVEQHKEKSHVYLQDSTSAAIDTNDEWNLGTLLINYVNNTFFRLLYIHLLHCKQSCLYS